VETSRWREIEDLFHAASEYPPDERSAFLDHACRDDESLRGEVESLLANEGRTASFLESALGTADTLPIEEALRVSPGEAIGPYIVDEFLGAGGMGEVYRGRDTRLNRAVAIKFLPRSTVAEPTALERFRREARAASALNHPRICTIHDIGEHEGRPFIVMEYMEGECLRDRIGGAPLAVSELLEWAMQICDALQAAHAKGMVHRDIKPANIFITTLGQIKILDFGLAKLAAEPVQATVATDTLSERVIATTPTRPGVLTGTLAYMSPEQARGEEVDARSDLFSLGTVMYEMATGQKPFRGATTGELIQSIQRDVPAKPSALNRAVRGRLERIVLKALEKDRQARYQSAGELLRDLAALASGSTKRRIQFAAAAGVVVLLGGAATIWGVRVAHVRWARNEALPRARLLAESNDIAAALGLLRQAETYLGHDPAIDKMRRTYAIHGSVHTSPPGADVYIKNYMTPDAPWEFIGTSPNVDVWAGEPQTFRVRVVKDGFDIIEAALESTWSFTLAPRGTAPNGMVFAAGGPIAELAPGTILPDYWIDRYEVTNRQYKEFVAAGGYQNRKFWKQPFVKDGRTLSFEAAMAEFLDATGRPGPAGWKFGSYPAGKDDFPVGGVSWYEAAAYAEFAGKSLPTTYQWYEAAGAGSSYAYMAKLSNFSRNGPVKAGSRPGISVVGAYDMAGNVREWCWNAVGARRYILGGNWNDSGDTCMNPENRPPFDRAEVNGFRCARSVAPLPEKALAPVDLTPADHAGVPPISDEVFRAYRAMFSYDLTNLNPVIESVEETPDWRVEKITFAAAYEGERVIAYLYLPRNARPPFQTIVYAPDSLAFDFRDAQYMELPNISFLVLSGRAVLCPIYKGTYERWAGGLPLPRTGPNKSVERDLVVAWSKDLGRAIDYLETRRDIDVNRLGFYGESLGAMWGPVLTQVEPRFKVSVLTEAGLTGWIPLPEIDAVHYLPRNHIPTLLIAGHDDYIVPVETNQKPLMRLLGTAPKDKRHVILDCGHSLTNFHDVIKEVVPWLDRYLGPVQPASHPRL
jgi:eukaryotic-like serine/threonine-protein kinase